MHHVDSCCAGAFGELDAAAAAAQLAEAFTMECDMDTPMPVGSVTGDFWLAQQLVDAFLQPGCAAPPTPGAQQPMVAAGSPPDLSMLMFEGSDQLANLSEQELEELLDQELAAWQQEQQQQDVIMRSCSAAPSTTSTCSACQQQPGNSFHGYTAPMTATGCQALRGSFMAVPRPAAGAVAAGGPSRGSTQQVLRLQQLEQRFAQLQGVFSQLHMVLGTCQGDYCPAPAAAAAASSCNVTQY